MRGPGCRLASVAVAATVILLGLIIAPQPLLSRKSSAALEHIFDYYTGPPSGNGDRTYDKRMLAQSFAASDSYLLTRIDLFIKDDGNDSVVNITFTSSDPRTGLPATGLTYASANGPSVYSWVPFIMDRPVRLQQNSVYWIELIDVVNKDNQGYSWAKPVIPSNYSGGVAADCPGSPCGSWNIKPDTDYLFATYGIRGPNIPGSVTVDSMFAGQGDPLQYTVNFTNTGSEAASKVWINMSLSSNLEYKSDDSALLYGVQHSSPDWLFTDVTVGCCHVFHVNVTVGGDVYDGYPLWGNFTLQYADRAGVMQEDHRFSSLTIARVPSLSFSKSVFPEHPIAGGNLVFTLAFTNSGSRPALSVWINDTLPDTVDYSFDTASTGSTSGVFSGKWSIGRMHMFNFTNVTPGNYRFDINVTVNATVLNGTEITNRATLYFTSSLGRVFGPLIATATARVYGASITAEAETWDNPVAPGDSLRYEVSFDNRGTGPSASVYIHDTLPQGVTYVNDTADREGSFDPLHSTRMGRDLRYTFINVNETWPHNFVVSVHVGPGVMDGDILTNHVCLNYTEWDGTLLEPSCAQSSAVVMMSNVTFIVNDSAAANPGDFLHYEMVVNNSGTGPALHVGIAVLEAQELTYYFDNSSFNGGLRVGPQSWRFDNVGPGNISLSFIYKVRSGLLDGRCFSTVFQLNYTDLRGRPLGSSQKSVQTCITAPVISLQVIQDKAKAPREETISYTIYYNNSGTGNASDVWINDTIPDVTVFYKSSEIPVGSSGSKLVFHFVDVAPGPHSMTVNVTVEQRAKTGNMLVNTVRMSYQDANKNLIDIQTVQTTAVVVDGTTTDGNQSNQTNALWVLIVSLLVILALMWLFVARKFYGLGLKNKARIDELFLLHRSGELIRHHSRSLRAEVDSDVLSAMLVAVQNFVRESFNFRAGDLEELKFGDEKIMLIHGEHVILAAVIDGPFPQRLAAPMREALDEIENRFGDSLDEWSGLTDDLPKIDDILSRVFGEKVA